MVYRMAVNTEIQEIWIYWDNYLQKQDEGHLVQFIKAFLSGYEDVLDPNFTRLRSCREVRDAPHLAQLPDDLLPTLGTHLKLYRKNCEKRIDQELLSEIDVFLKTLAVICRNYDNIPFVASCDFVSDVVVVASLLLHHNNDIEESSHFDETLFEVLHSSLYFLECLYDPYFHWRTSLSVGQSTDTSSRHYSPALLHIEIVPFFYDCFQVQSTTLQVSFVTHCLHLFGAILSGAKHNALRASCPATLEVLLVCIGDRRFHFEIREVALQCLHKLISVLLKSRPDQQQVDLVTVMDEYFQKWKQMCNKNDLLDDIVLVSKILKKLQKVISCSKGTLLQSIMAEVGWIQGLFDVVRTVCEKDVVEDVSLHEKCSLLLVTTIQTLSVILKRNKEVKELVVSIDGFDNLLTSLRKLTHPTESLLDALMSLACDETFKNSPSTCIVHPELANVMFSWLPTIESNDVQLWLADALNSVCSRGICSRMLCCEAKTISVILSVIGRITHNKTAVCLIKIVENLGCYSMDPSELRQLISILRLDKEGNQFTFTSHLMHALSTMAKREGLEEATSFFDFEQVNDGITVPAIAKWPGYAFTFHTWVRLNRVTHSGGAVPLYRRQLYSFCSGSGCGFEAFFLPDGILVIAVLTKNEYLTVPVADFPINDSNWHSVSVSHYVSRRPFVQSHLIVYIDGKQRLVSQIKCSSLSEPFTHCRIGSGGEKNQLSGKSETMSPTMAEKFLSNIPFPSFLSLPLPLKSGNTYDHGVTVLAMGMQDKVWGIPSSLQGQLSSVCIFYDTLQPIHLKCLHVAGPNNLTIFSSEEGELIELANKLVLYYHAKACEDALCVDLSPFRRYDGHLTGKRCETWDVKETINCIGGLEVLCPLIENARKSTNHNTPDALVSPEESSVSEDSMDDWVILPSSSYSEWKLEQNQAAGFLILIRNFIQGNRGNQEQFLCTNGVATVGALLQRIPSNLVNVHLLMATQLLLESTSGRDGDTSLRHALYQHILFDFRIWSKSDFTVRIGHIQYLSAILKDDRKYFRKKYGVLYLLDVIRQFYSPHNTNLSLDDCRAIRISLLGLVRYFVTKDVNTREMNAIVNFIFSVKEEEMLTEVLEMLLTVMEHRQCKDQVYLLIYEPGCIELFYCLLLNPMYSIQFRCQVLRVISSALKTDRVYEKSKVRLRLQDIGLSGLVNRLEGIPVSLEMAKLFVDQVLLTDNVASYQSLLVLLYFIRYTDISLKLQAVRQVVQVLMLNGNAPHLIALQHSWYDCILQLLVKQPIVGYRKESVSDDVSERLPSTVSASIATTLSPNKDCGVAGNSFHASFNSKSIEDLSPSPKVKTAQSFRPQVFDFDMQSLGNRSLSSSKASSLEDLTNSQSSDTFQLIQEAFDARLASICKGDVREENKSLLSDVPTPLKDLAGFASGDYCDSEDELCQLIANIVFTVMWKGITATDSKTWKERGQVFTCINIIALNNYLYKSHLELKRCILELTLHAAVYDLKEAGQAIAKYTENAIEIMKWTYDFVVIDSSPDRNKKLSGKLLDGVLSLLDILLVFEESPGGDEWTEMSQMGIMILLECAASENLEICAMATPKLHTIIQTRMTWSKMEEVFYLMEHLDRILAKTVELRNQDHYSFIIPLVKALIENAGPRLNLERNLPMLPSNHTGPTFFEDFQQYCQSSEWRQFIEKQVTPVAQRHLQQTVGRIPDLINEFWNECYEATMIAIHRRNREWGESRLRFQSSIMEPFSNKCIEEQMRYNNYLNYSRNQHLLVRRRWRLRKLYLFGQRGPWRLHSLPNFHWKLSHHENLSRMRLKLLLNPHFDRHLEASRLRDNLASRRLRRNSGIPQPQPDSLPMAIAMQAKADKQGEDSLNEDDLKALSATEVQEVALTAKEKFVFTEECELVVLMSVVKGRLEVTTTHVYFFDASQVREDVERYDFKWALSQLREVHLRRYNLRRSALEFFLLDQTNYFVNFTTKNRNKVYSCILSLRPPNLFVYSGASPIEVFKATGLTQKWVLREISNFDYLMMLNTFAGRTYNDLSQYPVFPWILSDYTSEKLDLNNPAVFRDLSRPVGVVNPNNIPEVKAKFDHFEDPTGLVEKFHYGTHYSNSAGVLHYLVRLEPFTSLHIELQSGRFDVADRQFHSIPGTWRMLMENPNDVKELIPEFFYLTEFLTNMNGFDLGKLQGSKEPIVDVLLPKWANTPEEFIQMHKKALESDYVSSHLNEWIDLIFGHRQKGPAAVEAFNVFYYCSYEGAVNLDTIMDPVARAAMEGMINNFGQTPCQLFKEPHPARLTFEEVTEKLSKVDNKGVSLLTLPNSVRLFEVELSDPSNPVMFIATPRNEGRTGSPQTTSDVLVTVAASGAVGVHNWLPYNKTISSYFTLDLDPTFTNPKTQRKLSTAFQPGIPQSSNLFTITHDAKLLYSGGYWDNSIRVFKFTKSKSCVRISGHKGVVTCLAIDRLSRNLISGSRDLTCIIWDISQQQANVSQGKEVSARCLQVLYGHEDEVTCVALMTELDLAVSGSKDGTINVYTVREGIYMHTLRPSSENIQTEISYLVLSEQGHVIAATKSASGFLNNQPKHSTCVYSVNGKHLWTEPSAAAVTALIANKDYVISANTRGQIIISELYNLKQVKTLSLSSPARHLTLTSRNTHLLASLQSGKLMVVGVALPIDLK